MSKLAVFFPGVGYHNDKPLLYFSRKITKAKDYENIEINFSGFPDKIMNNPEKMKLTMDIAYSQARSQLLDVDFSKYQDIVFVGKSVGTIVAAKYIEEFVPKARVILYTPLIQTFDYKMENAIAFLGELDPWSDVQLVKAKADSKNIKMYMFQNCNHSLETGNYELDLKNLIQIMKLTEKFTI